MDEQFFPTSSDELLELLDKSLPEKCPRLNDTEREIFFYAGKRAVVEWLKELKKHTEEQQLNSMME